MPAEPALIVGLGNPGPEYARTRHNVGYRVVETIAGRLDTRLKPAKGMRALVAEARDGEHRIVLAEPTTYMNLSGEAVRELARYYKIGPENIVVVHDDLDLPLAVIRVKRGGGDAGHNGLKHITRALRTPDYARVRIGIGRPTGRRKGEDYVLEPFPKKDEEAIAVAIEQAADAALLVVREGVEAAQQRYHVGEERTPKPTHAIRKQVLVKAPVRAVWEAWTTPEGVKTFFGPDARIELRRGGPYEIYFDPDQPEGARGSEGCKVLAFKEDEFLVFSWNAPPELPEGRKDKHTRVEVRLEPAGAGACTVTVAHTGWKSGGQWDETFDYFERAWDVVLERLQRRFEEGPVDWEVG